MQTENIDGYEFVEVTDQPWRAVMLEGCVASKFPIFAGNTKSYRKADTLVVYGPYDRMRQQFRVRVCPNYFLIVEVEQLRSEDHEQELLNGQVF